VPHWSLATVVFVVLYVGTFKLAWKMLARLTIWSATRRHRWWSPRFWSYFVLYRIVIAAPYLAFLALGKGTPPTLTRIIWGWVILSLFFGLLRFVGAERTIRTLWWGYGFVYDGLLRFYPYRRLLDQVAARLKLRDGLRLLELGCGTGNVIARARQEADVEVVGVDNSATMLRRAQAKLGDDPRVKLVRSDLMGFIRRQPDRSFDRISLVNVLYAIPDREELWRECVRVIRTDGFIVATTSDRGGSAAIIREHRQHESLWRLASLRLAAVVIIDFFISELAKGGPFEFPSRDRLLEEVKVSGGDSRQIERCYGGAEHGVNLLFHVIPSPGASH
jgi:ubiquinone/menaquinone biosynthesis C-methylase UbiE